MILKQHMDRPRDTSLPITKLYSKKVDVDAINNEYLQSINYPVVNYSAQSDFLKKNSRLQQDL